MVTDERQAENMHALYAIIAYCEEPYLCRRKMQLNFLGEDFNSNDCHQMCDNCRNTQKVSHVKM